MSENAHCALLLRPATIAVHDNGNMTRHIIEVYMFLK
jgi:hypothetical protein